MKITKLIKNPYCVFSVLAAKGWFDRMPDEQFLRFQFRAQVGRWPDLEHPKTFNEKLQWLKLYDRRPEYTIMADKYRVREYIKEKIGEEYLIPLLGVWDDPDEIDFDTLPEQFVLKCNHNSGKGLCICRDKNKLDFAKTKEELRKGLAQDYCLTGREWPYRDIPRKIVCEKYMEDFVTGELRDYKFFCFNGTPKALFVATERQKAGEEVKFDFFDTNYNHLHLRQGHPNAADIPEKPQKFETMKTLASKLSAGIPHVRIDFYEANGNIYFGEMTFYHFSGLVSFEPEEWDHIFGSWLSFPTDSENTTEN